MIFIMFFFPTQIWDTLLWGYIIFFIFIKHYICSFLFFSRKLFIRLGGSEVLDSSKVSRKLIIILRIQLVYPPMISEQRMQRRTLNEILPLSQIIYVIGKNNLKCIFFMTYCQRKVTFFDNLLDKCWLSTAQFSWKIFFFDNKSWKKYI